MGDFIDGNVQGNSYGPPRKWIITKQEVWCTRIVHGIVWNNGRLVYSERQHSSWSVFQVECFAETTEKGISFANLMDKEVENLDDYGCPKIRDLFDEEFALARFTHSDKRLNFTVLSAT